MPEARLPKRVESGGLEEVEPGRNSDPPRKGPTQAPCSRVLMIGTDVRTMGGISTVVRGYLETSLFSDYDITYVSTHCDGSHIRKLWYALKGWTRTLVELMRGGDPLLHVHLSSRASFWRKLVVCRLAALFRRPYILHVHGSEFMEFYERECSERSKRIVRDTIGRASLVLALSQEWEGHLRRICADAEIEVVPNAVPVPDRFVRAAADDTNLTILFLGRLGARKGSFELVSAFARVARRFPNLELVLAGDGPAEPLKQLADSLNVSDKVSLPGWLDAERCKAILSRADIFALPSHAEGLPMALLEAMSHGLAIVSCPVGGIPQVVESGRNGILVAPGDVDDLAAALRRLAADGELRRRLGDTARQTIISEYSIDRVLRQLSEIYERFGVRRRPRADA